jgi:protein-tyrosine phosphatase
VRWGRIYRSGELDALTDGDLAKVDALGIKLVCDLRSPSEVEIAPEGAPARSETSKIPVFDTSVDRRGPPRVPQGVARRDARRVRVDQLLLPQGPRDQRGRTGSLRRQMLE